MPVLGTLVPASPLDASNDSRLAFPTDSSTEVSRALGNPPVDFASMVDASWQVEYRLGAAKNNDTYGLSIYIANGATMLAGASSTLADGQTVDADVVSTTDTMSAVTAFTYVNASATKAQWDGASVYLVQDWNKSQAGDGVGIEVDYVAITGNYSTSDIVLADDLEVSVEVSTPAMAQTHVIAADDLDSAVELSTPTVAQTHHLAADDLDSAVELSTPTFLQVAPLLADDLEVGSELSTPALLQVAPLLADDLDVSTELTSPTIAQTHKLTADDLDVSLEVSTPDLLQISQMLADDLDVSLEVSTPSMVQTHHLLADDLRVSTEITVPSIIELIPPDSYYINMPSNWASYFIKVL